MRKVILVLGNSHINSFRRAFSSLLNEKDVSADIVHVTNNLLKYQWNDFARNDYLRYLQFKDNIAPDIDLRDKHTDIDLVLMGLGLLGTGVVLPYGRILAVPKDDRENARKYTPKLPLLSGVPADAIPGHTTGLISKEDARITYRNFYKQKLFRINQLSKKGRFNSIYWITEPDMTESAGRFRFGEDLVKSGLYAIHRNLARNVAVQLIKEYGYEDNVILHPEDHNVSSGFTDDRFRASIDPFCLHASPEYYKESTFALLESLQGHSEATGLISVIKHGIKFMFSNALVKSK